MRPGPKWAIRSGTVSGPVPGCHRIRSVRSGADSLEAYPVSGPVRCHIPKSVFRAIRSGLVSGLVLVFTDPVSGPSGRRFCVPPDPAGSGAVHYPVQRGLSDFSLASALPVVPHRVPARWSLPSMVRLTLRACRRVELQSAPKPPQRRSARCPGAMSFDTYLLETAWHRRLRRIRKLCPAAWATWIALNQQDHLLVENHLVARLHERCSFMRCRLWKRNRSWRLTTANIDASCRKLRRHLRRAWHLRMCNRMSATTSS